jgi:hypothetical protein
MRTTLNVDDDVFRLAKALADARRISVGKALSELARQGTQTRQRGVSKSGFITFGSRNAARLFGPEDVQAAMDAEDAEIAAQFLARK